MNTARFKPSHFVYNDRINDPRYTVSSSSPSASGDSTLFAGKELEKSSGLYDFEARFGNTFLGRFTTMDPMAEKWKDATFRIFIWCYTPTRKRCSPDFTRDIIQLKRGIIDKNGW